ncbi:RPM1-interacting protein 4-like [Miscanthus floridulus]|uniref:RPM1-interacting protein 4-like n=1 Tax=Miscanthus floridulus TaxID=154761 RepID=UPI00345946A1
MAHPEIPAFGDWETTGNTPYTQKFEDARKNKKTGIPTQPNDPRRNPEHPRKSPLHPTAYKTDPQDQGPRNPPHRPRPETDDQRHSDRPTHREPAPRRHANPQREQGSNAGAPRSPYRTAVGSASPMQPNNQSKPKHKLTGMQTPERRPSSEGYGQHMPGRSRMKPGGCEPEEEVAVPPFGEWDDANAASGEKYTGIFNRVRDDRLSPTSSARQPSTTRSEENKVQQKCSCCIL